MATRTIPPIDEIDDSLFNYDVGDAFHDVDTSMDVSLGQKPAVRTDGEKNVANLGIDEEIKVTKKRAPVPKLDENRLLSPAGIQKLRRVAKERVKFKGKGHEYADVARLLNAFQLWLDDLYPRAKFADGLAIIEGLGHTKRMQTMRREWIQEGKPRETLVGLTEGAEKQAGGQKSKPNQCVKVDSIKGPRTPVTLAKGDDDLYAATPRPVQEDRSTNDDNGTGKLFLEDTTETVSVLGQKRASPVREESFHDDEEALLALSNFW